MYKGTEWTQEEDDILRERYSTTPAKKLAEELGRSEGAVMARAQKLGLYSGIHGPNVLAHIILRQEKAGFIK